MIDPPTGGIGPTVLTMGVAKAALIGCGTEKSLGPETAEYLAVTPIREGERGAITMPAVSTKKANDTVHIARRVQTLFVLSVQSVVVKP